MLTDTRLASNRITKIVTKSVVEGLIYLGCNDMNSDYVYPQDGPTIQR